MASTVLLVGLERAGNGEPGLESGKGTDFGESGGRDARDDVRACDGRRGETGGERDVVRREGLRGGGTGCTGVTNGGPNSSTGVVNSSAALGIEDD